MSLPGLIRHLSEMERVYGYFALSRAALERRYCGDDPEGDFENLMKLVGEYARHAGHADLLRERIDGLVGE